jgi:hypothetical protein
MPVPSETKNTVREDGGRVGRVSSVMVSKLHFLMANFTLCADLARARVRMLGNGSALCCTTDRITRKAPLASAPCLHSRQQVPIIKKVLYHD